MKERRHETILSIIRDVPVATQEELAVLLATRGFEVTQATISRDIRELQLVKVASGDSYRYAEPPQAPAADAFGRARRSFTEFVKSVGRSRNIIVLKTTPGTANAVAASIDEIAFPEVLATLAGDDTVLMVIHDPNEAPPPTAVLQIEAELHRLWGK